MSIVIRAHFDGKTLVLDEPADLPVNVPLEFDLRQTSGQIQWNPEKARDGVKWLTEHAVSGLNIPDEALRRENLYEDRGL